MPEVFDVVAYLASKGHHGRQANGPEVTYNCFFDCNEPEGSRKRKLYVNSEEGWYDCKVCGASGGTTLLQRHFGDEPGEKLATGEDTHTKRKILNWAADIGTVMLSNNDDQLLYLMGRGLSAETILEAKLGWVGNRWSLTGSLPEEFSRKQLLGSGLVYRDGPRAGQDFFYDHLLIPYLSRGNVVQIRGRACGANVKGGKYLTGPGEPVRLYGIDDLDDAEDVIITEGEFDRLVLKQHLQSAPDDRMRAVGVVGLAGANGFQDGFVSYFSNARRVFIALDPDDTGKRYSVKIKEMLGARARILELPAELPKCDWTEFLLPVPQDADEAWRSAHPHAGHGWADVLQMFGKAAGKRIFSMFEVGNTWRQMRTERAGLRTGFSGLDSAIIPGLLPGQLMVVLAKTGTGKTLLLCNLAYNMRQHRQLMFSLEMTREEVYERLQRIFRFYHPLATDDQVERGLCNIWICDENRLSDRDFVNVLEEYQAEVGASPEVVHVDYLGYYARGQKGNSQYEKVTNAVMQLKAMAKNDDPARRFVLISPAQVNRVAKEGKPLTLDDARDSGAIEETADFLLSIFRYDDALQLESLAEPTGGLELKILKSRHGGKDKAFPLQMDPLTLAIVDDKTPSAIKAKSHFRRAKSGLTYEELRAEELAPVQLALRKDLA